MFLMEKTDKHVTIPFVGRRFWNLLPVFLLSASVSCTQRTDTVYLSDKCKADTTRTEHGLVADTLYKKNLPVAFSLEYPDSLGLPNPDIPFKQVDSVWAFSTDKKYAVWFNTDGYLGHTHIPVLHHHSDICYISREECIVSCSDLKSPALRYHAGTRTADTVLVPSDSLYYAPLGFLGAGIEKLGNRFLVPFVSLHELDAGYLYSVFDSTLTGRKGIPGFFRFEAGVPYYPYQGNCQLAVKNDHAFFVAFPDCGTVYELELDSSSADYRVVSETVFPFVAPVQTALITGKEQMPRITDLTVASPYWFNVKYDAPRGRLHRFHKLEQPIIDPVTRKMKSSGDAPWVWVAQDLNTGRRQAHSFSANEFMYTLGYLQQQGRYLLAGKGPSRSDTHTHSIQFYEINLEN